MGKESTKVRKNTDPSILDDKKKKAKGSAAIIPSCKDTCVKANLYDPDDQGINFIGYR